MKLNLGCGPLVIAGFENIDWVDHPGVRKHDLRNGLPDDIAENSVDFINASQFLEHLNFTDGVKIVGQCFRVLKKHGEGSIRISVPDADLLIKAYLNGSMGEFASVQPPVYAYTREQMLKLGMILFGSLHEHGDSGHKMCYNFEGLEEILRTAGFRNIRRATHDDVLDADVARNHEVIVVATT